MQSCDIIFFSFYIFEMSFTINCLFCFQAGADFVAQAGLELKLLILLPQSPEYWYCRCVPPHRLSSLMVFFGSYTEFELRALCLLGKNNTTWVTPPASCPTFQHFKDVAWGWRSSSVVELLPSMLTVYMACKINQSSHKLLLPVDTVASCS
jgi:hypothetical protein